MKETKRKENDIPSTFTAYLRDIKEHEPFSLEEERDICIRAKNGDKKARELLINNNLQIVVKVAVSVCKHSPILMDVIQEGNIALMKAIDNFDPYLGFRFSTFAYTYILNIVKVKAAFHNNLIHIPDHAHWKIMKIKTAYNDLAMNDEPITVEKLVEATGLPRQTVVYCLPCLSSIISIDYQYDTDGTSIKDCIANTENAIDDCIDDISLSNALNSAFKKMKEREALFLKMAYGLDGFSAHTLQQIGDEFGLSRERVRQIVEKAKNKIKKDKDIQAIFLNQY